MQMDIDKKQTLTVSNIRNVNITNIMNDIIRDKTKTRNELSKKNNISLMTVKHIVDDLIDSGILVEKVSAGNEVGRKPKALEIAETYGNIVCVNLTSVEEISFLIYDIYEELLDEQTVEFQENAAYKENLTAAVRKIKERMDLQRTVTVGIAVFVPSAYYEDVDLVNYDLIADFKDLHIKKLFVEELGIQNVSVFHDVVPAAHSEYSSRENAMDSQFYFYCGYGVGGFYIHQGIPVAGAELMAGEVGKMLISDLSSEKGYTTLEELISVNALNKKLKDHKIQKKLKQLLTSGEQLDKEEAAILDEALELIARTLYNLLWVYNPDRLVIDSCYKEYGALIAERFQQFMESMKNEAIPIQTEVRQALYDEYHMMRGCFRMARDAWVRETAVSRKSSDD